MEVIALDRGFGNTKASVGGNTVVLQTALLERLESSH